MNKLYQQKALVEVKKKLPNRTLAQNSYFYLLLSWFSLETGYSVEEVKIDIFKRLCNRALFEREITNKQGKTINVLRSSSDLTTAIDRFRNYSAAEGIYLPAPNEHDFLTHIQKEIERCKDYL